MTFWDLLKHERDREKLIENIMAELRCPRERAEQILDKDNPMGKYIRKTERPRRWFKLFRT